MFQSFDQASIPSTAHARLTAIRQLMDRDGLDYIVVPHADEQQSEYLPPRAERLAWLTSFTGSAGEAIIGRNRAIMFTDGRYTLQVSEQTDGNLFDYESLIDNPPVKWLEKFAGRGETIGFDPWLHTENQAEKLAKAAEKAGAKLVRLASNPVDTIYKVLKIDYLYTSID